jgi:hypothetical protein
VETPQLTINLRYFYRKQQIYRYKNYLLNDGSSGVVIQIKKNKFSWVFCHTCFVMIYSPSLNFGE